MFIETRNTNTAGPVVYQAFNSEHLVDRQETRNGPARRFEHPVTILYNRPQERVNFWPLRDANPFFHLMEALWMMAGRKDVEFVARFVSRMREFSDDGRTLNGAYGWRMSLMEPQGPILLERVVHILREQPTSRRAYVSLWYNATDLYKDSLDLPCNVGMCFQIVRDKLCLAVFNRSNDAVWGGVTGANVVHFSVFQEYVAAALNRPMGWMSVTSANLHLYETEQSLTLLKESTKAWWGQSVGYEDEETSVTPLVTHPDTFLEEVRTWCDAPSWVNRRFKNDFLNTVAQPLYKAYLQHKEGRTETAFRIVSEECACGDWKYAAQAWLYRRLGKGL